ncbi:FadR/GntR family transcriptional regulator [Jeotgalicoccus meleagridis]|mgnify:FL=1|jgi:GntR family transcriptional repressor for pyruvate dehydrogenase complex|uniref:HTH-type transcriptional regulator LutR n=1 Tax=Jeotgalicoccus meleagridis TaxID=2759181 RepID=A0A6V7RHK7_9STAP|nr:GntR family transcriptional regulator [Jeotgalicoccus meleagridis]CAD2076823.1 HTH-type transcriptional regulator LutR [Jeotgalicoccus meleagridis]HIW37710.1 GntR family transcriptional regulator [Candidatus Jeotgalicoccus stercoravium]
MENKKGLETILEEIDKIIEDQNIGIGEKIPSERYLKERLNVSRQSVREALRALELIGVIYVKRGEGTYLANIDSHQLYKLIAKYLIRTDRQYEELNELMHMIDYYYEHKYQGMKTVKDDDNQIVNRIYSLLEKYANGYEN